MYIVYDCICISIHNQIQIWKRLILMQVGAVQPELLRRNSIWKRWKYKIMEMLQFLLRKLLPAESRKSWHLRNCRNQTFIHRTWQRFIRDKLKRNQFCLQISNTNVEFCKVKIFVDWYRKTSLIHFCVFSFLLKYFILRPNSVCCIWSSISQTSLKIQQDISTTFYNISYWEKKLIFLLREMLHKYER